MSFLRSALRSSPRSLVNKPSFFHHSPQGHRFASTATPQKSSNTPLYFIGAGVLGAGLYYYLEKLAPPQKPKQEKSPLDPENWKDFKLKKVIPYNHNTSRFVFELPNNEASLIPVASCLVVKSSDPQALLNEQGKPIIRPYTPISPPEQPGELTLLVKKYDTGNASKHIHTLKEGQTLAFKGPILKFPYKENEFEEVALIGGGSGITPLYQLLTHALESPTNKAKFTLLFSNVTEKDILLREEFDALKKKYGDKFNLVYLVDKPSEGWGGPSGFINADVIKKHVPPADLGPRVKVFVCGPPGQVAAVAGAKDGMKQGELGGILKQLGYTMEQVYKF